jgi:CheY-like chemotaxis protein
MGEKKILIAEDDPDILELTSMMLESAGFQTICANNGRIALERFTEHQADIQLVLLDLIMPELGGREAAESIRLLNKDIGILFVTAYVPDEATDNLREPVLRKPYRMDSLLESVASLLPG